MNLRMLGEEEDLHSCFFYVEHETIKDEGQIFRGSNKRHNAHAFKPSRGPNLMVKRHIRGGQDIHED